MSETTKLIFVDAGVGGEGAEDLGGVDAAAGSGDGEGDVAGFGTDDYRCMETEGVTVIRGMKG